MASPFPDDARTAGTPRTTRTTRLEEIPVTLFGHAPTSATLRVVPRSPGWRARKAALPAVGGVLVAPVVAVLPPHAPWAVIALATGGVLARRKWKERYTVLDVRAPCPRCGAELDIPEGARLRFPHPVTCPGCGHEPVIQASRPDEG